MLKENVMKLYFLRKEVVFFMKYEAKKSLWLINV